MFGARNKQLVASDFHANNALILTFSQEEKEPVLQNDRTSRSSLPLRERAGVRVISGLMRRWI
jgi:hypothetical protein